MKHQLLRALLLLSPLPLMAQYKPQYQKQGDTGVPAVRVFQLSTGPVPQDTSKGLRMQMIFSDSAFGKNIPPGYITAIYFRRGTVYNNPYINQDAHMYNVQMSLGYTMRDTFRAMQGAPAGAIRDTFINSLTKVCHLSDLNENSIYDSGTLWMRFPLTANFYYNGGGHKEGTKRPNMVAELAFGPPWVKKYFSLYAQYRVLGEGNACMTGYRDSIDSYLSSRDNNLGPGETYDFGFDLGPAPVEVHNTPARLVAVYPNPAAGILYIDGVSPGTGYRISDFSGERIQQGMLDGKSPLSVDAVKVGNYLLQISNGENTQTIKFTKQ